MKVRTLDKSLQKGIMIFRSGAIYECEKSAEGESYKIQRT